MEIKAALGEERESERERGWDEAVSVELHYVKIDFVLCPALVCAGVVGWLLLRCDRLCLLLLRSRGLGSACGGGR